MADIELGEMTCQEIVELVTAYFEEALPTADRERFEAHLAECPYCQTYLEQMRQMIQALSRLTEEMLPAEAKAELLRCFHDWKRNSSAGTPASRPTTP